MARRKSSRSHQKKTSTPSPVKDYRHEAKRKNNPDAGLASYDRVAEPKVKYSYDPHLDPKLVWSGKAEHTSFEVDTVSLHIHERISTQAILKTVQREDPQRDLFSDPQLPLNQAVEFYQHDMDWANRLILGDSLLVMNSLLQRELMAGKVQMIYVDPPYGVAYNSNFQPSTRQRDVKDGDDKSLTREPEQIKAYRDTWRLGIHSYLTYLRDRLLLCRDLLHESGSIFLQISDENLHHVRELMDEVFGAQNQCATICYKKPGQRASGTLPVLTDFILWYAKDKSKIKYHQLYVEKSLAGEGGDHYGSVELSDGTIRPLKPEERVRPTLLPKGAGVFETTSLYSAGWTESGSKPFEFNGKIYRCGPHQHWSTNLEGMKRLNEAGRIVEAGESIRFKRYFNDFPLMALDNMWQDTGVFGEKLYVVQTSTTALEHCLLMTTDAGDLVFDPTCGSGTTAYVAEQWGRRWITCDTSRVALALARQRLLTATFPYYQLAHPEQGVSAGFIYETVPHITLKSIAQNEPPQQETLYDNPLVDRKKVRVSGPFTVEAIPMPVMEDPATSPIAALEPDARKDDIARRGRVPDPAGDYISTMIDLLKKDSVTFPGGKKMKLENLRPIASGGFVHAEAEAEEAGKKIRVAVSFGPRHGPVTAKQVEEAIRAAQWQYQLLILAGFAFDPEAQAFIQKNPHPHLKMHLANICPDVQLTDLLKTTQGSQLFTVFGQPDVEVKRQKDGTWVVELEGVDLYDPNTGELYSDRGEDVAAWFLDQDYDGRTFCVCQAFFPGGGNDPWEKLSRALKGTIDPEKFEALRGTTSQPFHPGKHNRIAIKVIDHRGNEVIWVMSL